MAERLAEPSSVLPILPLAQRATSGNQRSFAGWRSGGRVPEHVEDRVGHQSALDVRVNRGAVIAGLKAVPAELRVIPPLDPDPPRVRGQFALIGLDFCWGSQAVPSADDFRHRDAERTQIHIARMGTADQNQSRESHSMLTACGTDVIVGCTSAGEFTNDGSGQGLMNVTAIRASNIQFTVTAGTNLSADYRSAARSLAAGFRAASYPQFPFRSALILLDALAGHADQLIETLTVDTAGTYRFFGGGAGDDGRFQKTHVFCGTKVLTDAAVALEILSKRPVGIGARHGWQPASAARHGGGFVARRQPERVARGGSLRGARREHVAAVR